MSRKNSVFLSSLHLLVNKNNWMYDFTDRHITTLFRFGSGQFSFLTAEGTQTVWRIFESLTQFTSGRRTTIQLSPSWKGQIRKCRKKWFLTINIIKSLLAQTRQAAPLVAYLPDGTPLLSKILTPTLLRGCVDFYISTSLDSSNRPYHSSPAINKTQRLPVQEETLLCHTSSSNLPLSSLSTSDV